MLASYDPAHSVARERYWPWRHSSLPLTLLDQFYYNVAAKCLPENPNEFGSNDLHGGCAGIDEMWCCWFRFLNGGRDQHGRAGRFVILCAFVRREDMIGRNWSGVLDSKPFTDWANQAPLPCPLPPSLSLEFDYAPDPVLTPPELPAEGETVLDGPDAIQQGGALCSALAKTGTFHALFERKKGVDRCTIMVAKEPEPDLPPKPPEQGAASLRTASSPAVVDAAATRPRKSRIKVLCFSLLGIAVLLALIRGLRIKPELFGAHLCGKFDTMQTVMVGIAVFLALILGLLAGLAIGRRSPAGQPRQTLPTAPPRSQSQEQPSRHVKSETPEDKASQ